MDYSPPHQSFICQSENLREAEWRVNIEGWLTSLRPDSPANRSVSRGENSQTKTAGTDGLTPSEPFALLDQNTSSWKTSQGLFLALMGISELSSVNWPKRGMIANGLAYQRPPLVRHTSGIDCGLWDGETIYPTPTANQYGSNQSESEGATKRPSLAQMASTGRWPSEKASDWRTGTASRYNRSRNLNDAVAMSLVPQQEIEEQAEQKLWPTPTVMGNNNRPKPGTKRGTGLATAVRYQSPMSRSNPMDGGSHSRAKQEKEGTWVGGKLNPVWVEWLMGWPQGWTDLKPLEMDKFQWWLKSFGSY